ncbi:hypothetical protein TWF718_009782 [Orbilia javanica]|uniref:Uncharacterized protein n=1 Tax=Orbilia javanica TaxID=47235 RepID=A0AAN8MN08_9PEZI
MKKAKGPASSGKPNPPPPQAAIFSRLSFLHQASSILPSPSVGLSRYYTSHLLSVSKKSVQRLSPAVKHTICKRCSSLLLPGKTSTTRVENKSKNGRKPWADVVVVTCGFCGAVRRFPTVDKQEMKERKIMKRKEKDISVSSREQETGKEEEEHKEKKEDTDMTGT